MKTRTKVQYVPTVLLDNVLAIKLKQHDKKKFGVKPKGSCNTRKVVIYKMISTADWKKKEEARIAEEARIKVSRETPKTAASIYQMGVSCGLFKQTLKTREEYRATYNEYYFLNKEKILRYQREYRQRRKDQLTLTKPKVPPTDAK
jgi:hypothetical protein